MNVACLVMIKNEDVLLEAWLRHHSELFGPTNLFVFDNGSDSEATKTILEFHRKNGINIIWNYDQKNDFVEKGSVIFNKIKELEATNNFDFYFPLDCDELIGLQLVDEKFTVDRLEIEEELNCWRDHEFVLRICCGMDNHPFEAGWFQPSPEQRKCFVARNRLTSLDHGFHEAATAAGTAFTKTRIVYFHFHFRDYGAIQQHAREKLSGWLNDFSREALIEFADRQGAGFHLVYHLLKSEQEYREGFSLDHRIYVPQMVERFAELGLAWPFTET